MATLSELVVELKLAADNYSNGIRDAKKQANEFQKDIKPLKEAMTDLGAAMTGAGVAILGALTAITLKTADYGDALNDARQRTGATTETLSKLGYAAELSGSSFEGLSTGIKFLSKNMELAISKGGDQAAAFNRLGISTRDLAAAHGDVNQIMLKVADRFKELPDGAEKSATAMQIFGKSGTDLIPLLNEGSDGLKKMGDEAQRLGIVMSGDAAKAGDQFNDRLFALKGSIEGFGLSIGNVLLPILSDFIVVATNIVIKIREWADANPELVKVVAALAIAITGAGGLLLGVAGLLTILPALTAAFVALTGPIGLVVVAVTALVAAFAYFPGFRSTVIDYVLKPLTEALGFLGSIMKSVGEAVIELATGKPSNAMKTLGNTYSKALDTATEAADFFDNTLKAVTATSTVVEKATKKTTEAFPPMTKAVKTAEQALKDLELALKVQSETMKAQDALLKQHHSIQFEFTADLQAAAAAAIQAAADLGSFTTAVEQAVAGMAQASYNANQMQKDFDSVMRTDPGVHIAEGFGKANDTLTDFNKRLEENAQKLKVATEEVKESAGKIFDDMFIKGENVFSSLGNLLKGGALSLGRTIFEDVTGALLGPVQKAFNDFFTSLLESTGIKSFVSGLGEKLGGLISGIFGGGGGAAGGVISSAGGAAGGVSSAAGGAAGAGAGLTGSLISAAGGVLGGVISALGSARMEGTLNAIEANTRFAYIEIRDMMDGHLSWILNYEKIIADRLHDELMFPLLAIIDEIAALPSAIADSMTAALPAYQGGSHFVPATGPAMLHRGEQVIPAGQSAGMNITVNVRNAVGSMKELANEIAREINNQVRFGGYQLYATDLKG